MKLIRSPFIYAISYIILMLPTYVLPYFGSNSSVANSISSSAGVGFLPQWWIHVWFLASLVLISWIRSKWIDKGSLPAFSIAASLFDILPVLNFIPLVPTIFHIVAIIIGANSKSKDLDKTELESLSKRSIQYGLVISTVCIIGIAIFSFSSNKIKREDSEPSQEHTHAVKQTLVKDIHEKKVKTIDNTTQTDYQNPFSEGQRWQGDYTCAQGNTPLSIKISKVTEELKEKKYTVNAVFSFGDETHTSGSYNIVGEYDGRTGKISFKPLDWIDQPSGYVAVGLNGSVYKNNLLKGKIQHSSCTSFKVAL